MSKTISREAMDALEFLVRCNSNYRQDVRDDWADGVIAGRSNATADLMEVLSTFTVVAAGDL